LEGFDVSEVVHRLSVWLDGWWLEVVDGSTRGIHWPSWEWVDEASGIWVIDHSHGSERVRDNSNQSVDIVSFGWGVT